MAIPAAPPVAAVCGAPLTPGPLAALPEVELSSLPLDDQGLHEIVLRVRHVGGRFCYRYTFNGALQNVPPVLRVHRGERFALRIVNELSGPATGAVMSASSLPPCSPAAMPATEPRAFIGYLNHMLYARSSVMPPTDVNIHLHGFQGPASQENIFLSTLSTSAHACEYDITIPRTQPPGTYFYHPHAHGMAAVEIAGGLTGMWIVDPDTPQIPREDDHAIVLRERVPLVRDDPSLPPAILIAKGADKHEVALRPGPSPTYDPFSPPPWPSAFPLRTSNLPPGTCGRFAAPLVAINGVDAPARVTLPYGEPQLLRILNATPDSIKYLRLGDASGKIRALHVVGRDGVPVSGDDTHPLARYLPMHGVMLVPGERIDVLLTLKPADRLILYSDKRCIAPLDEVHVKHDLLTISAGSAAIAPTAIATAPLRPNESRAMQLLQYARTHPALIRRRALTYTQYFLPNAGKPGAHPEFYITETSNVNFHEHPFWPMYAEGQSVPQPDIVVKRGTIEEWYLFNATLMPHTFHIHQMAFAAEDERPQPVMLDTVLLRVGRVLPNKADPDYPLIKPGLTRVLLDFRNVPRGTFVFHCHMIFHEDRGMMGIIRVI